MSMFDKARKAAADTLTDDIIMVDVDNLFESPDNFFELSRIEELAETILGQGGVKENLIVKPMGEPENGEYEIISGHRRTFAIRHLLEQGEEISRYLPCLVQNYEDNDDKLTDLILMNVSARTLTDSQLWKCYEVLNEMFLRKKKLGEKFGRVQTKLAETLGVSQGQVSKMQVIEKKAIDEVKSAVENGSISINTAEKISKLDVDEQKELVSKKPLSEVKPKDIPQTQKSQTRAPVSVASPPRRELDEEKSHASTDGAALPSQRLDDKKSNTNVTFSKDDDDDEDSGEELNDEQSKFIEFMRDWAEWFTESEFFYAKQKSIREHLENRRDVLWR